MVGVEQWAEVRRMHRVDGLSAREISRRTGLARDTIARLLAAPEPPRYVRQPGGSKLDPFKDWICEQLQADPRIQSQRLREMAGELGYRGGSRFSMTSFARSVRGFWQRGRFSGRSVGRVSWFSAICGSRRSGSRSVTVSAAVAGLSPARCVGRVRSPALWCSARRRRTPCSA